MKYIIVLLLAVFSFADAKPGSIKSVYQDNGNTYWLKANYAEVTTWQGEELVIRYSVYKNGHFLHGVRLDSVRKSDVGRVFSCYARKPDIVPLKTLKHQVGWVIEGFGLCGNTTSNIVEIIVPADYDYYVKTILSKETPVLVPKPNSIAMWYFQQEWGNKGTAVSFYIPHKLTIEVGSQTFYPIKKEQILDSIGELEKSSDSSLLSFLGIFVAGIRERNPELMAYAVKKYYKDDEADWYQYHFKNSSKKSMQKLVEKMRAAKINLDFVDSSTF